MNPKDDPPKVATNNLKQFKILLDEEELHRWNFLKDFTGIKSDTELLRYCLAQSYRSARVYIDLQKELSFAVNQLTPQREPRA
jgi:hypothetical protein